MSSEPTGLALIWATVSTIVGFAMSELFADILILGMIVSTLVSGIVLFHLIDSLIDTRLKELYNARQQPQQYQQPTDEQYNDQPQRTD